MGYQAMLVSFARVYEAKCHLKLLKHKFAVAVPLDFFWASMGLASHDLTIGGLMIIRIILRTS